MSRRNGSSPVIHRVLDFGAFSISVADGWEDITATLDDANAPLTVADPISGVGALQFSPAIYTGGRLPRVRSDDLTALLDEFAARHGLGDPFDRSTDSGGVAIEGASFHSGEDLIRAWYASDGKNVMLVTYCCEWSQRGREASQREIAVRSIRFAASAEHEIR
jgi:hypothetical protein